MTQGTEAAIQTQATFVWRNSRSSNRTRAKFLCKEHSKYGASLLVRHGLRRVMIISHKGTRMVKDGEDYAPINVKPKGGSGIG